MSTRSDITDSQSPSSTCGDGHSGEVSRSRSRSNHRRQFDGRYCSVYLHSDEQGKGEGRKDCNRSSNDQKCSKGNRSRSVSTGDSFDSHQRGTSSQQSNESLSGTDPSHEQSTRKKDTHSFTVRSTYSTNRRHRRRRHEQDIETHKRKRIRSHSSHTKSSKRSRKHRNEIRSRSRSQSCVEDDKDGYMVMEKGQLIRHRYKVDSILGEGTFGRVACCYDKKKDNEKLAIKVIKNVQRYRDAARVEIKVLDKLAREDPRGRHRCITIHDWFDYHGHICLVFSLMGKSIFDFLKSNGYKPYPIEHVRAMTYQLCDAVKFMHDCGLTHTDLKPENILFVDSSYSVHTGRNGRSNKIIRCPEIRVIDFGSATFDKDHHSTTVATRHYRAPEVILEMGWSHPCDVWAVGCILFEIYTGRTLFMTHDSLEHLAMMERVLGSIPSKMAEKSKRKRYFKNGRLVWDRHSSDAKYVRRHVKRLPDYQLADSRDDCYIIDLVESMLIYEPHKRITMSQALTHPFFHSIDNRASIDSDCYSISSYSSRSSLSSC